MWEVKPRLKLDLNQRIRSTSTTAITKPQVPPKPKIRVDPVNHCLSAARFSSARQSRSGPSTRFWRNTSTKRWRSGPTGSKNRWTKHFLPPFASFLLWALCFLSESASEEEQRKRQHTRSTRRKYEYLLRLRYRTRWRGCRSFKCLPKWRH